MQTAKNLFLWPSRSVVRKGLEIPLALALDLAWTKRRLIEVYLNIAEWGPDGVFGGGRRPRRLWQSAASRPVRARGGADGHRPAQPLAETLPRSAARRPCPAGRAYRRPGRPNPAPGRLPPGTRKSRVRGGVDGKNLCMDPRPFRLRAVSARRTMEFPMAVPKEKTSR